MSASEEEPKKPRRPRREFKAEFKEGAVKLVLEEGKTIPQLERRSHPRRISRWARNSAK